jgi:GDP-D-mannose dehydratase
MDKVALIVGASGISGNNLAQELLKNNWTTYGITRNSEVKLEGQKYQKQIYWTLNHLKKP